MNCCESSTHQEGAENGAEIKNTEPKRAPKLDTGSFVAGILVGFILFGLASPWLASTNIFGSLSQVGKSATGEENLPSFSEAVTLPAVWGGFGAKMVESGVIDAAALEQIYAERGGLDDTSKKLLYASDNGKLVITSQNSTFLLNLLWALGLGNKNPILENGPMQDKEYGGAGNFASTGGWTIAKGKAMDHYSMHSFIVLTPEQQALVSKVSQGIYRPCCGNSTYFPDCNHGMAMLGLLELLASQDATEEEMYKTALIVNSYWFPDTYRTIAKFMAKKGVKWADANPVEILGKDYSSAQGYARIVSQIQPVKSKEGGSCGV